MRSLALAFVVATLVAPAVVPAPLVAQDLEEITAQRESLEVEVHDAIAAHDDLLATIAQTENELAALEARTVELAAEVATAGDALRVRARSAFMRGDAGFLESMLSASGPQVVVDRARLLAALTRRSNGDIERASALRIQLTENRTLLAAKREELTLLEADAAATSAILQEDLEELRGLEGVLVERRDRQRALDNAVLSGTYACLIDGPYDFRDTWGAPRSGGRSHKGVDVMGLYGAEVYAFTSGSVSRLTSSSLGGINLYLWGDDGIEYFYAHLSDYASGIYSGRYVDAGELIAFNGDSGNARGGPPHVHFEVHPGGGGPVNPYPYAAAACF